MRACPICNSPAVPGPRFSQAPCGHWLMVGQVSGIVIATANPQESARRLTRFADTLPTQTNKADISAEIPQPLSAKSRPEGKTQNAGAITNPLVKAPA